MRQLFTFNSCVSTTVLAKKKAMSLQLRQRTIAILPELPLNGIKRINRNFLLRLVAVGDDCCCCLAIHLYFWISRKTT